MRQTDLFEKIIVDNFAGGGGAWKLEAVRNIAAYFEGNLKDLVEMGRVVVLR